MIDKDLIYVVNPAYYLRNDINKIVFCCRENIYLDEDTYENFFTYIHPFNAQLLSFFNGENTLKEIICKAAMHFSLSYDDIENIVSGLIENPTGKSIKYKWSWMYFPKNTLVKRSDVDRFYKYELNAFITNEKIDLNSFRLNIPTSANLLLTMKCHTNCIYCYANRSMKTSLMTYEQIKSIIHQARDLDMLGLDINGGEVLLHPDCMKIFKEMIDCGFSPLISTKIPIDANVIKQLKAIGVKKIQLSLDSVTPIILSSLLNVDKNYFYKIDRMLHDAEKESFPIIIHGVLSKYTSTIEEISRLLRYLEQFSCINDIRFSPAGFSLYKEDNSFMPSKSQLDDVFAYISNYKSEKRIKTDSYFTEDYYKNSISFNNRAVCSANTRSFVILPDGRVTVCEELYDNPQFIIGDLTKNSIMEVWNSSKAKELFYLRQDLISPDSPCSSCNSFKHCREIKGVCWKEIIMAYGKNKWDYPDARCPRAPKFKNNFFVE